MSIATIANRYARALADVSIERGEVSEVSGDLHRFAALLAGHAELREVFASPAFTLERKRAILGELLGRLDLRPTSANFLQLLLANSRLHQMDQVLQALTRELDARENVVSAEIVTARELGEEQRHNLEERLGTATGTKVRLSYRVDPTILGGLVARIGSTVYDGSIKNQLTQIRQRLLNATIQ